MGSPGVPVPTVALQSTNATEWTEIMERGLRARCAREVVPGAPAPGAALLSRATRYRRYGSGVRPTHLMACPLNRALGTKGEDLEAEG